MVETKRLKLRRFTAQDAPFILELVNSPGWLEFIGDRNIKTSEAAKAYLENGPIKSYQQHGFGLSLVELKEEHKGIGLCGILKRDELDSPEIGFAFLPDYTGKGYAFEIARATLSHAQEILKLPVILAITNSNNKTSIRLLEKIGMRFIRPFSLPHNKESMKLYSNRADL